MGGEGEGFVGDGGEAVGEEEWERGGKNGVIGQYSCQASMISGTFRIVR